MAVAPLLLLLLPILSAPAAAETVAIITARAAVDDMFAIRGWCCVLLCAVACLREEGGTGFC